MRQCEVSINIAEKIYKIISLEFVCSAFLGIVLNVLSKQCLKGILFLGLLLY